MKLLKRAAHTVRKTRRCRDMRDQHRTALNFSLWVFLLKTLNNKRKLNGNERERTVKNYCFEMNATERRRFRVVVGVVGVVGAVITTIIKTSFFNLKPSVMCLPLDELVQQNEIMNNLSSKNLPFERMNECFGFIFHVDLFTCRRCPATAHFIWTNPFPISQTHFGSLARYHCVLFITFNLFI